ncbi:MAG: arylesterase [Proteobacteria bacterium]|uniref:arylesterase n=1 Tax=Aquabacterium sp. TaxID=1872578 RepID=UPI0035C6AE99|nr:arylesterase [Pseudomonadota bacterium]
MTEVFNCTRRKALRSAVHAAAGVALGAAWLAGGAAGLPSAQAAATRPATLLVLGDSLSAEYGLARGTGWVALLGERLMQQGRKVSVVNASISGETTAGGRSRLPALLRTHKPALVVIELGANDALRGFPLRSTEANLRSMAQACKDAGARVLIVGMQVPPNYGRKYTQDFAQLFATVAKDTRSGLVPFLLKDVADRPDAIDWFQPDRIHPLAKAHPIMLEHVWAGLKPML